MIWGFYYAVGDAEEETYSGDAAVEPMVRYYWHLLSSVAAPFVAAATSALNAARIPFLLKVLSDPNDFHRADSGVIFVRRHYLPRFSEIVAGIHGELKVRAAPRSATVYQAAGGRPGLGRGPSQRDELWPASLPARRAGFVGVVCAG